MDPVKNQTGQGDDRNLKNALISMFPSNKSYLEFKNDAGKHFPASLESFLELAQSKDLIKEATEEAFLNFIENNQFLFESHEPPEGYNFSRLLDQVLNKWSVNSLIVKLNSFAEQFKMIPVQASMFSRLKKDFLPNTPKKRNLLRLFAFWMGLCRPQSGWHYEMLLQLPRKEPFKPEFKENEGVRMAFSLQSAGDILNLKTVEWLKKELRQCIQDINLNQVNLNRIS
ncbi:MAG: hypothetical protein R6U29_02430, partial [Desulfosudaceae bacterium]